MPQVPSSVASERCGDDLGATYSSKAEDWADAWGVAPQVAVIEEEEEPLPPVLAAPAAALYEGHHERENRQSIREPCCEPNVSGIS